MFCICPLLADLSPTKASTAARVVRACRGTYAVSNPTLGFVPMLVLAFFFSFQRLQESIDDPTVAAVVLRVDSPGGSAVASDSIAASVRRVKAAGKPVVCSMGDLAASGGYMIAAACDTIVAQPTTITGSIGVIASKLSGQR